MNKHRGSDFNEFMIEEGLTNTNQPMTPTPRTDAVQFQGWPDDCIPKLARLARELERELAVWKHEAKRLEAELEKFDEKAIEWWCEYQDLKSKAGDDRAEIEQIKATLANPHAVHINMLRGTIQWTPANLRHLLGET